MLRKFGNEDSADDCASKNGKENLDQSGARKDHEQVAKAIRLLLRVISESGKRILHEVPVSEPTKVVILFRNRAAGT